jgi:hypothetical protein
VHLFHIDPVWSIVSIVSHKAACFKQQFDGTYGTRLNHIHTSACEPTIVPVVGMGMGRKTIVPKNGTPYLFDRNMHVRCFVECPEPVGWGPMWLLCTIAIHSIGGGWEHVLVYW